MIQKQVSPSNNNQSQQIMSGYIQLKRKRFWVIRYASILNGVLLYFVAKGDQQPRCALKLSECLISKININKRDTVIKLSMNKNMQHDAQDLLIMPQDNDFNKWFDMLSMYSVNKNDQKLPNINNINLSNNNSAKNFNDNNIPSVQRVVSQSLHQQQESVSQSINLTGENLETFPSINQNSNNNNQQQQLTQHSLQQFNTQFDQSRIIDPQLIEPNISVEAQLKLKVNLNLQLGEYNKKNLILTDIRQNMKIYCQRIINSQSAVAQQHLLQQQQNKNQQLQTVALDNIQDKLLKFIKSTINTIGVSLFIAVAFTIFILLTTIIYLALHLFNWYILIIAIAFAVYIIILPFIPREIRQQISDTYYKKKRNYKNKFRVKSVTYFPFSQNDFLYALKQNKYRYKWQPFVSSVQEEKDNITININSLKANGESQERFVQTVLKERNTIHIIEHSNFSIQRIFILQICDNQNILQADNYDGELENGIASGQVGFNLEYYSKTDACLVSDMRSHNSPNLIFGLIEFLTEIKNNPKSIYFDYYRKRLDDICQIQQPQSYQQQKQSGQQFDEISLSSVSSQQSNQKQIQPQDSKRITEINLYPISNRAIEGGGEVRRRTFQSEIQSKDIEIMDKQIQQSQGNKKKMMSTQDASYLISSSAQKVDNGKQQQQIQQQQQQQQLPSQLEEIPQEIEEQKVSPDKQIYVDIAEKACDELQQESEITQQNNWQQQTNKDNFKLHTKEDTVTGDVYSRGESIFPCNLIDIVKIIIDLPNRGQYDDLFESGEILDNITENIKIVRQQFKGMKIFGIAPRDFVMVIGVIEKNGKTYIVAKGINMENVPQMKGVVRGDMKIAGWIIEKINDNQCRGVYMAASNAKGKLPMAAKNHAAEKQGYSVKNLRKIIEKSKGMK